MSRFDERLERDLGHIADRATPSPTAWEAIQSRIAEQVDEPEMEIIMLEKAPPPPRRIGLWIMSAAAALLLVVGGIVLLTRDDDEPASVFVGQDELPEETVDESPAPPESADPAGDEEPAAVETVDEAAAVQTARQFLEARDTHDGDAMWALVATDAAINEVFVSTADEYVTLANFEAALGWRYLDPECSLNSPEPPARVLCNYTFETEASDALGFGPYGNNSMAFVIDDGLIVEVSNNVSSGVFVDDVYLPFQTWIEENHPADADRMFGSPAQGGRRPPIIAAESIALWGLRMPEYVASLEAAAVDVAVQFLEARNAHDADAVRALVADDAVITGADWIETADEYPLLVEFERAADLRYADATCDGGQDGRVRCTYTLESTASEALGVGPFTGNSFLLVIDDGLISEVTHNFNNPDWVDQVDAPFRSWLEDNHPEDLSLLYESVGTGVPLVTTESVPLWEARVAEYSAALPADS